MVPNLADPTFEAATAVAAESASPGQSGPAREARDGRTDKAGRPSLLQAALLGREFDDAIRFTSPPRAVQRPLFAALAPFARLRGLRGSYLTYVQHTGETVDHLEQLPPEIEALIPLSAPVRSDVEA